MSFSLLVLLFLTATADASIFDTDDRVDTKHASAEAQELAKSVPALVPKHRLKALPDGKIELQGTPMVKLDLCPEENFSEEKNIANCSASLIGKNKILTAAHCISDEGYTCDTYSIVFDYQRTEIPMRGPHILDRSQVYHCKSVIFSEFDRTLQNIDLAVIELDRDVTDRDPLRIELGQVLKRDDPLMLIGYPLGISQKVVETGKVLSVDKKNISFKHDLDSFSVNSGSPIFSRNGVQVGVLVRGTGPNLHRPKGGKCSLWHVDEGKGFSEGNDLSPLSGVQL